MANSLTPGQEAQLATLIFERNRIYQEVKLLEKDKATFKEALIMSRYQLFPLEDKIRLFLQENGFPNMLFEEIGLVGLKSLNGGVVLPAIYEDISSVHKRREMGVVVP